MNDTKITTEQDNKIKFLLKTIVEPKIEEIIKELNKTLNKENIHVGASIEWFYDAIKKEE